MKLVILDRDGVINRDSDAYVKAPHEWQPIAGSIGAIARLSQAGFRIAVATNQSGIARGLYDLATLAAMHSKMHQLVQDAGGHVDAVFFCPHAESDHCSCRKPKPGMVLEAIARFRVAPNEVVMIGDSLRDLQAAASAGCTPMLVHSGNGLRTSREHAEALSALKVSEFPDLAAAAQWLVVGSDRNP
jgi:D-glycero-D-manno-heptose 1,7-bisphosphate phosphatase